MKHSVILAYLHQAYKPEYVDFERAGDSLCLYSVKDSLFNARDYNQLSELLGKDLGNFYFDSRMNSTLVIWHFFVLNVTFD